MSVPVDPWDLIDPDMGDPYLLGRREDAEIASRLGEDSPEHKRDQLLEEEQDEFRTDR